MTIDTQNIRNVRTNLYTNDYFYYKVNIVFSLKSYKFIKLKTFGSVNLIICVDIKIFINLSFKYVTLFMRINCNNTFPSQIVFFSMLLILPFVREIPRVCNNNHTIIITMIKQTSSRKKVNRTHYSHTIMPSGKTIVESKDLGNNHNLENSRLVNVYQSYWIDLTIKVILFFFWKLTNENTMIVDELLYTIQSIGIPLSKNDDTTVLCLNKINVKDTNNGGHYTIIILIILAIFRSKIAKRISVIVFFVQCANFNHGD